MKLAPEQTPGAHHKELSVLGAGSHQSRHTMIIEIKYNYSHRKATQSIPDLFLELEELFHGLSYQRLQINLIKSDAHCLLPEDHRISLLTGKRAISVL